MPTKASEEGAEVLRPRVTVAQWEGASLEELKAERPRAAPISPQNPDGSFRERRPGLDGPMPEGL